MKIIILGYGLEGQASYKYWSKDVNNQITIADQRVPDKLPPKHVPTIFGETYLDNLEGYDLVIRTSGLDKNKIKTQSKIWSVTNEMFAKCPAEIIGVTGTKGKGTTASMIASIFKAAGRRVWLTGNIGVVSLEDLDKIKLEDIIVYELSSFQLWDIEKSPHVAVITMIEPEHLNVHKDFNDYIQAKANIRRFQTDGDICFYHPTNQYSKLAAEATDKGTAVKYNINEADSIFAADGYFWQGSHKICSTKALQIVGQHNIENACAAIAVAKFYDLSNKVIELGLNNFKGLPHRLEFVRQVDGVKYYNDSFSSSTPATVAAINAFSQPEILIMGGVDRGGDFSLLADRIKQVSNVKNIILIGEIRDKLFDLLSARGLTDKLIKCDAKDMVGIVELAKSLADSGDVVILSPGCGSFDMFKDFYERGEKFKELVKAL